MDTLADLASMQHPRTSNSALHNTPLPALDQVPAPPAPKRPSLAEISRTHSGSASSIPLAMNDIPTRTPPPRAFTSSSLPSGDLATIEQLTQHLAVHPNAFAAHARLVELLHAGLVAHAADDRKEPRAYDLLQDLEQAFEAMSSRYALGEDLWMRRLEAARLLAIKLDHFADLTTLCEKAVAEEVGSPRIWAFYGDWLAALCDMVDGAGRPDYVPLAEKPLGRFVQWTEEDHLVAAEVFGRQKLFDVLKRGSDATKFNLSSSHLLWDRYTTLVLHDIGSSPSPEAIATVKTHFLDRLTTPHAGWDSTFQQFSTFISRFDNASYEEIMMAINAQAADAKERYALRELHEVKLQNAMRDGDRETEWITMTQYLEWEMGHNRKKKIFSYSLLLSLYQRALLRFPTVADMWEDFILFLADDTEPHPSRTSLLPTLNRACEHCPWSGALWAAYIQAAEREDLPFPDIGQIKHKATSTGLLDGDTGSGSSNGGFDEALAVHAAWAGFLRRRAFRRDAADEERDVAEVGLRSAIEDVETTGHKQQQEAKHAAARQGVNGVPEYRGDPSYRLQRIYIKFLDQKGDVGQARETWRGLVTRQGDSYEFWLKYYEWEMRTWARLEGAQRGSGFPRDATHVLQQASRRQQLDWPEKILEAYQRHCEDHEDVATLQTALRHIKKRGKEVVKRREKEAARAAEEAALMQAPQLSATQQQQLEAENMVVDESSPLGNGPGKRKRDETTNGDGDMVAKRNKPSMNEENHNAKNRKVVDLEPTRDREHTSVIVKNLPWDATEKRVRHFFRECGSIKSVAVTVDQGAPTSTATIEFDDKADVATALTKDHKSFDGTEIRVESGEGSTLFVTNFAPDAGEEYIRDLFGKYGEIVDVRFPSHSVSNKRRFCYLQFRSFEQAKAASSELHNASINGDLKLVVKLSDPARKGKRHGAIYEGREVYVSNVDWNAQEKDVQEVFEKYGRVERVRIPRSKEGKSKGMAFVAFEDKVSHCCPFRAVNEVFPLPFKALRGLDLRQS